MTKNINRKYGWWRGRQWIHLAILFLIVEFRCFLDFSFRIAHLSDFFLKWHPSIFIHCDVGWKHCEEEESGKGLKNVVELDKNETRISLWKERPNGIGSWKCQENDEVEGFLEKEGNVTTVSFHVKWKEIVSSATMTWVEVWGKGSIKRKERMMFPVNLIRFALILAMHSYSGRERSRSNQDLFPSVKDNRTVVVRKSFGGGLNTFCLHWQDSGENCHNLLSYSRRRVNAEVLAKWLIADPCATTTSTGDWRLRGQGIHMNSEWKYNWR